MLTWKVGGRYGYYAVDEYDENGMRRDVITGITRKLAERIAGELNTAYSAGRTDEREFWGHTQDEVIR